LARRILTEFKDHPEFSMPWPDRKKIDMEDASRSLKAHQTSAALSGSAISHSAISSGLHLGGCGVTQAGSDFE
jgi:hypothetical protein